MSVIRSLSIVVPAFNEASTIETVVQEALSVGAGIAEAVEVVVCDDGSTDETYAILRRLAEGDERVRVLHREINRGIEASVRALYAAVRYQYVFFISADRQWPMTSLVALSNAIEKGADLVVGIRRNKRSIYTPYRLVVSGAYEWAVRLLGSPVGDPGSIKLGRADCFRLPLVSDGYFADGERVVRAARAGYRVTSCDVDFRARGSGKALGARPAVVVRSATDALRTCASLILGRPRPRSVLSPAEPGLVSFAMAANRR